MSSSQRRKYLKYSTRTAVDKQAKSTTISPNVSLVSCGCATLAQLRHLFSPRMPQQENLSQNSFTTMKNMLIGQPHTATSCANAEGAIICVSIHKPRSVSKLPGCFHAVASFTAQPASTDKHMHLSPQGLFRFTTLLGCFHVASFTAHRFNKHQHQHENAVACLFCNPPNSTLFERCAGCQTVEAEESK